ncbi:uncharacterized abhydrolase domain-containing protein DDB_G0269086-like [Schistocerca americana]|uniref:uncharacterized abhydrolase domain-containing protein DDB_G0269086-like n=1 Tax=Schistocerca americana TaxID=7009 RepID=UPI001F4F2394|nr:uncharacterized abhydrolase domain-containing protein DDB_G0269086-like [Schistocerca americana]
MFKNLFSGARPKKPGGSASTRASRESLETDLNEEPVVKVSAKRSSKDKSPKAKPQKEKPQKEKSPKEKKRSGTGTSPFGSGLLNRRGSRERRRAEAEQERRLQEDLQERDRILRESQEGRAGEDGLWEIPLDSSTSQTVQLNGHSGDDVTEGRPQSRSSSRSSSPATSPTEKEPPKKAKAKKRGKDKKGKRDASSAQVEFQPPPPPSVTLAAASRKSSSSSSSPPLSPMGPRQPSVSEMVEKFEKPAGGDAGQVTTPAAQEVQLGQKVSLVELKVQESMVVQQMRERQQRERMEEFERSTRAESLYATVEPRNKKKPEAVAELPPNAREELEKQAEDIVRQVREALEAEQNAFEERLQKRKEEESYRESRWKLAMETVDEEWRAAAERLRAEEQRLRGRREADLQEAVAEARQMLRVELDEERLQALAGARLALRQHAEAALREQAEDVLRAADQMVSAAVAAALSKHKAKLVSPLGPLTAVAMHRCSGEAGAIPMAAVLGRLEAKLVDPLLSDGVSHSY